MNEGGAGITLAPLSQQPHPRPVSDTLQALGGFALIIGLFVAYIAQRVAQRRAKAPQPVVTAPEPAPPQAQSRGSINWGAPFIYCLLLVGVARGGPIASKVWLVIYVAMFFLAVYSTFSPKELAGEQKRHPGTTRGEHYIRLGIPYVLFPGVSLVLVLAGQGWAVLLPAIPWVLILLFAIVVLPVQALKRRSS